MSALIAILVFVVVSLGVFRCRSPCSTSAAQRPPAARTPCHRQKAGERQPSEELALLRDEMLSEIPAFDSLLRRSNAISDLQTCLPRPT